MDVTTIKVPRALRDRIAERAAEDGLPFASVIERALDAAEQEHFWERVREQNRRLRAVDDAILRDGLDPADSLARDDW